MRYVYIKDVEGQEVWFPSTLWEGATINEDGNLIVRFNGLCIVTNCKVEDFLIQL